MLRLRRVEGIHHHDAETPTRRFEGHHRPTAFAAKAENRKQIAAAIAPANYLNRRETVLEQILTGTYAQRSRSVQTDRQRIDFDPFPWESFAVWIMTQMKRWGQIKGEVDYAGVAKQVYLATDTAKLMRRWGSRRRLPPARASGDGQGVRFRPSPRSTSELRHQARGLRREPAGCGLGSIFGVGGGLPSPLRGGSGWGQQSPPTVWLRPTPTLPVIMPEACLRHDGRGIGRARLARCTSPNSGYTSMPAR